MSDEPLEIPTVKLRTTLAQFVMLTAAQTVTGLRWALGLAFLHNIVSLLFAHPLASPVSWWIFAAGYLLLSSAPGNLLVVMLGVRLLRLGIRPGSHPRGGRVHLQLMACERLVSVFGIRSLGGTRWAALYARAIGCRVGRNVDLRTTVPITGWATLGSDCAVDPETDLAGWWLEAGTLHIGPIHIGRGARIGGRSILMPGAHVGAAFRDRARHVRDRHGSGRGGLGRIACGVRRHRRRVVARARRPPLRVVDAGLHRVAVRVRLDLPVGRRPRRWSCSAMPSATTRLWTRSSCTR